jgi:hypothetical protein
MQTPTYSRLVLSSGQPHKGLLKTCSVHRFLLQLMLFMAHKSKLILSHEFLGFLGGITENSVRVGYKAVSFGK